jgi:hypothetical protein
MTYKFQEFHHYHSTNKLRSKILETEFSSLFSKVCCKNFAKLSHLFWLVANCGDAMLREALGANARKPEEYRNASNSGQVPEFSKFRKMVFVDAPT